MTDLSIPSSDRVKTFMDGLEAADFAETAFTTPKPLHESTVAILTSAALHHPEQAQFDPRDTSFRQIDPSRRDFSSFGPRLPMNFNAEHSGRISAVSVSTTSVR